MSALPTSWASCSLLECADFVRGVTYTKGDALSAGNTGTIPILRANNIQAQTFDWNDLVHVPESLVSKDQELQIGDVVIATSSGSLSVVGKAAQVRSEIRASFGAFCGVLRPHPQIQARYYGHFFSSAHYRSAVSDLARGVNINNLKRDHFQAIQIPIAPLAEQKRIADKLDTVLTRVDAVNTRLARVAPLLKRFRQSVLAAAFTGRLTNVAATALPSSWQTVTLGSLITHGPKNGLYKPSSAYGDGVRILRIDSFYDGKVSDWGGLRLLSVDSSELKQFGLKNGDIVINRVNSIEYLGKCALIEGLQGECVFESNMMKFRLSSELANPHFVRAWLCSEDARTQIVGKAKHAVNQASINQSDVCSLKLQLPPLSEQTEIVRRVETLFAFADRLEARLAQAQAAATRLTPALLAKAFRGELVPQDPNDEPAAELLRRLQAQRATAAPAGRTGAGRGRGRKAVVAAPVVAAD